MDPKKKLSGFTIILGKSEYADLCIPYPAWAEREGTITNAANMELNVNKAKESGMAINIIEDFKYCLSKCLKIYIFKIFYKQSIFTAP